MADAYASGLAFQNFLGNVAKTVAPAAAALRDPLGAAAGIGSAVGPTIGDFLRGASGAGRPSVTVALPAATPVKAAAAPVQPAVVAAPAAPKAVAADPLTGLSGLSFRQLLTLAQTGQAEQRATPRPTSTPDQAGQVLSTLYQRNFANDLKNAGNDPAKQAAAYDAFEKKMLPIALKGNTADAAIFNGSTPEAP